MNWYQTILMPDGNKTPGAQDSEGILRTLDEMGLPTDLSGKRVLDVGAGEGYFAFECEKRGAEVVVIDLPTHLRDNFAQVREWYGSQIESRIIDVQDTPAIAELGTFDVILMLGVIYHLRHPLLALDNLFLAAKPNCQLFIETHMLDGAALLDTAGKTGKLQTNIPGAWQLVEHLNGDRGCFWFPSRSGLDALLKRAGFTPLTFSGYERGISAAKRLPAGVSVETESYAQGILKMHVRKGVYNPLDRAIVGEVQHVYGQNHIKYHEVKQVIDVGAHIGAWTRFVLVLNPEACVIAVEPDPENFAMLTLNTADYPTVTRLNGGMGFIEGRAYIGTHDQNSGGHVLFDEQALPVVRNDPHRKISVVEQMWTLEQLIDMAGEVDVLKLDCEGAEISAIARTPDAVLKRCQWIVGEYHNTPAAFENEFAARLNAVGFEMVEVEHHEPHNLTTFVAKRKDAPRKGRKLQPASSEDGS